MPLREGWEGKTFRLRLLMPDNPRRTYEGCAVVEAEADGARITVATG